MKDILRSLRRLVEEPEVQHQMEAEDWMYRTYERGVEEERRLREEAERGREEAEHGREEAERFREDERRRREEMERNTQRWQRKSSN